MSKIVFRKWDVEQGELFPPAYKDLVPSDHLVHFIRKVVAEDLELETVYAGYESAKGQPPYHPGLMTALLLYGYCKGVYTSRRIEEACEIRLDFRALVGNQRPDHSTICEFRKRHRDALSSLFVQVLSLCRDAGLTKMGHVALDGTKMRANASKRASMSYKRMKEAEPRLAAEVAEWFKAAGQGDEEDDAKYGKDRRGDEVPTHIQAKVRKLVKIRSAKARLETAAKAKKELVEAERAKKEEERGRKLGGPKPKSIEGVPEDKAQSNFTDPESNIMKAGSSFEQCYNAQAAVDADSQVIVAQTLVSTGSDIDQLIPLVDQIEKNTGRLPEQISADAGYCSEANLEQLEDWNVDPYIATGRQKHGASSPTSNANGNRQQRVTAMREKLRTGGWESPYRLRKHTVEPVFGQVKEARWFRRFLRRGRENVAGEWSLLCIAHNLLKLAGVHAATEA